MKEALMAGTAPPGWYDISLPLKQGMHNLILDPVKPKIYRLHEAELGSPVTITMLEMLSHTGTHIDCPRHFIPDGSTVTDMALDATIGPARVIEIEDPQTIKVQELEKHNIRKGERILCKTANSPRVYESPTWLEDYVFLGEEAAVYLAEKEILLFGMDCITVGYSRRECTFWKAVLLPMCRPASTNCFVCRFFCSRAMPVLAVRSCARSSASSGGI
jgi:arylformamidase